MDKTKEQEICNMYLSGSTIYDIIKSTGVSQNTVYYVIKKNGVELKSDKRRKEKYRVIEEVKKYFASGMSIVQMCEHTGLPKKKVMEILLKYDTERYKEYVAKLKLQIIEEKNNKILKKAREQLKNQRKVDLSKAMDRLNKYGDDAYSPVIDASNKVSKEYIISQAAIDYVKGKTMQEIINKYGISEEEYKKIFEGSYEKPGYFPDRLPERLF